MANVKLSATQVAILSNLSDSEVDTGPVFKEFTTAIKLQYGIPDAHKLRTGSDDRTHPDYATLYRKKTGEAYAIDPTTGKWVDALAGRVVQGPTTAPAYVPEYRWFAVNELENIDDLITTITGDLDFEDGDRDDPKNTDRSAFSRDGYDFEVTDGELYIRLERGEF